MEKVKTMKVGGWNFYLGFDKIQMDELFKERATDFLKKWVKVFPQEESWVSKELGVPSLIVRLDCVNNGKLEVYEVEERPAGIGISSEISDNFFENITMIKKSWPKFKSLISDNRDTHDDSFWLERLTLEEALDGDDLLLVRSEPEEVLYHKFQSRSVSTLVNKGDKSYGEKMGLWKKVQSEDFFQFPWEKGFCLKPKQSSKCRGVEIFHPTSRKRKSKDRVKGASTKTRIRKTLVKYEEMYLQSLIEPEDCPFFSGNKMALRIFFGYNVKEKEYQFLGGVWNSRPNLKIHGASDTVMGIIE